MHKYYTFTDGEVISADRINMALSLVAKLKDGFTIVELSDSEVYAMASKVEAIKLFHERHGIGLIEAKAAIEHLRGE